MLCTSLVIPIITLINFSNWFMRIFAIFYEKNFKLLWLFTFRTYERLRRFFFCGNCYQMMLCQKRQFGTKKCQKKAPRPTIPYHHCATITILAMYKLTKYLVFSTIDVILRKHALQRLANFWREISKNWSKKMRLIFWRPFWGL